MSVLYNLSVFVLLGVLKILGPFSRKIAIWLNGRRNWENTILESRVADNKCNIWFHCASLGEFEQGKPVMEAIKKEYPDVSLVVTFFSPSGYEARKQAPIADAVFYLPADTPSNADQFMRLVKPKVALFVKSEIWPNFFKTIKAYKVPLFLLSARFHEKQSLFGFWGSYFRKQLAKVDFLFVQDNASRKLLKRYNIYSVVTGDTRFDQVATLLRHPNDFPLVQQFVAGAPCLVVGSCWLEDVEVLLPFVHDTTLPAKIILAPHDIGQSMVQSIQSRLKVPHVVYSKMQQAQGWQDARVLIVDNIGMLATIYRYAQVAYVGGAFKQGLHNILEPAVYGIPVVFGPEIEGFPEAKDMLEKAGVFSVADASQATQQLRALWTNKPLRQNAGTANKRYMEERQGATEKIMTNLKVILAGKMTNL